MFYAILFLILLLLLLSFVLFVFVFSQFLISPNNKIKVGTLYFLSSLSRSFTNGQWYCFNDQSVTRVSMITGFLQLQFNLCVKCS